MDMPPRSTDLSGRPPRFPPWEGFPRPLRLAATDGSAEAAETIRQQTEEYVQSTRF